VPPGLIPENADKKYLPEMFARNICPKRFPKAFVTHLSQTRARESNSKPCLNFQRHCSKNLFPKTYSQEHVYNTLRSTFRLTLLGKALWRSTIQEHIPIRKHGARSKTSFAATWGWLRSKNPHSGTHFYYGIAFLLLLLRISQNRRFLNRGINFR